MSHFLSNRRRELQTSEPAEKVLESLGSTRMRNNFLHI